MTGAATKVLISGAASSAAMANLHWWQRSRDGRYRAEDLATGRIAALREVC